jgi:hypothetical protein
LLGEGIAMKEDTESSSSISETDVTSVLAKLEKWKVSLSSDEQRAVDRIIDGSADINAVMAEQMQVRKEIAIELPALMGRVIDRIGTGSEPDRPSWMKIGPIWVKAGASGFEVSPRIFVERGRQG